MRSVSRFVLNSALTISSMFVIGCAVMTPQFGAMRHNERCELRMSAARLEEGRGNLEAAKQLYTEIHKKYPQNSQCLHRLAIICTQQKHPEEAEAYYRQSFAIDPNNAELLADMGYAAFLRKDYGQAEMFLDKSVRLDNNDRVVVNNLAITRAWLQKDADSLATFRIIYGEVDSIRRLATIQAARGDHERSELNYELANRMDPPSQKIALSGERYVTKSNPQFPLPIPPLIESVPPPLETATYQLPSPSGNLISFKFPASTTEATSNCSHANACRADVAAMKSMQAVIAGMEVKLLDIPLPPPAAFGGISVDVTALSTANSTTYSVDASTIVSETITAANKSGSNSGNQVSSFDSWGDSTAQIIVTASTDSLSAGASDQASSRQPSVWRKVVPAANFVPGSNRAMTLLNPGATQILQASVNSQQADDRSNLQGICLVTLIEERRITPSSPEYVAEFQSQKYGFSTEAAREKFRKNPLNYVPAAGGLDIVSVRNAKVVEEGSIDFAVWYQRQLYLFATADHAEAFRREPHLYVNVY